MVYNLLNSIKKLIIDRHFLIIDKAFFKIKFSLGYFSKKFWNLNLFINKKRKREFAISHQLFFVITFQER